MKINELKQTGTKYVDSVIPVFDEDGNEIGTEIVKKEVPVMEVVVREMTAEEEAEAQRMAEDMPPVEPTVEEQLADLSDYVDVLTEMVLGGAE